MTTKILLVDDSEPVRWDLRTVLSLSGDLEIVGEAANGLEAMRLTESLQPDVVLIDLEMPVMDGYEATRQIRQQPQFKDLPIIALTANTMKGDKEKVLAAGMNDYIAKPFNPDVMFITMAKWIK